MDLQEEGIGFVAISQALAENGIAAARFLRMDKWVGCSKEHPTAQMERFSGPVLSRSRRHLEPGKRLVQIVIKRLHDPEKLCRLCSNPFRILPFLVFQRIFQIPTLIL